MNKKIIPLIVMLLLFASVAFVQAQCWDGIVVAVIDGNTLLIERQNSRGKVKLYGVDAPALGQLYASEAKIYLQDLVVNKKVTVCPKKTQGTLAAEIHVLKGFMHNVNQEMIRKGFAKSIVDQYKSLENSARKKSLGLWSAAIPALMQEQKQKAAAKPAKEQRSAVLPAAPSKNTSSGLSVYKVQPAPQSIPASDNATQVLDPVVEQRNRELEILREQEQQRVSDDTLSLTYIDQFKMKASFQNVEYESYAGLVISFYYWSTTLDRPVDWNDGDVNCDCSVIGHFSEGTNTRIARTDVLLKSFRDRVYIDIPYSYLEDDFVELLSCTVECRLSAGIFDLKSSDKVYLKFTGRPRFYPRPHHY